MAKKLSLFVLGGPNKYYDFSEKQMNAMFAKIKIYLFSQNIN